LNDESFEQQYLVRQLQAFGFSLEGKWTLGTSAQNMCPHLFFLSSNANVLVADGLHGRSIYSATTDGKLIETANDYFVKWRRQKNYPKVVWQYSGKRPISEALELHAEMVEQYLAEHNLQQIAFTEENLKALLSRKYKSSV